MGDLKKREITCASEFLAHISRDFADERGLIIFRGQSHDWKLVPKIARTPYQEYQGSFKDEEEVLDFFKRRAFPHLDRVPASDWHWLFIAQHHGVPTRLLDWTSNALVALWFAVRTDPNTTQQGVQDNHTPTVWAFEPTTDDWLNKLEASPFDIQRTQVVRPVHVTERIIAQSGYFSIHKRYEKKGFISFDERLLLEGEIEKYCVQRENIHRIQRELDRCGINESVLFPDLAGVSNYVTWHWARGHLTPK
jgi:hypothetical protein